MPYRLWRHVCQGREVLTGSPDCAACGANGVFDSWRLSTIEAACVYRYVYEFEPIGPHRPLVDRFLAPLRTPCVRCGGLAVLTIDIATWSGCPTCEGTGGVWSRSMEEVETVRRQILAQVTAPRTAQLSSAQPRRRKGYSSHGLSFAEVERAFAEAERILGTEWQIKGRGHCRRATLDPRYSSHAARGAARSWAHVTPHGTMSLKRLLPVAIIEKAAEILRVEARLLMSREY